MFLQPSGYLGVGGGLVAEKKGEGRKEVKRNGQIKEGNNKGNQNRGTGIVHTGKV